MECSSPSSCGPPIVGAKFSDEFLRHTALALGDRDISYKAEIISWLIGEGKPLKGAKIEEAIHKSTGAKLNRLVAALSLNKLLNARMEKAVEEQDRGVLIEIAKSVGLKNAGAVLKSADEAIAKAKQCRACGCTSDIPCEFWNCNKHVACSWKEPDLCSNPECAKHDAKVKAKKEKK